MGLEDLKQLRADDNAEYGEPPYPGFDFEEPPPRLGDTAYIHSVVFNADRFPAERDQDALLAKTQARFPNLQWTLYPAKLESLPQVLRVHSEAHAEHFRNHGFVTEIHRPGFKTGVRKRTPLCQQAWDALCARSVLAEAIVDACEDLPRRRCQNEIFPNAKMSALAPILGKSEDDDDGPGTLILTRDNGLLLAPRSFGAQIPCYWAQPITLKSAFGEGRRVLSQFTSDSRDAIRRRVQFEVTSWSEYLEGGISLDGLALRAAQELALLRVQATDWKLREEAGYVLSGVPLFAADRRARETKEQYVRERFEDIVDAIRQRLADEVADGGRTRYLMPELVRFPENTELDTHSYLLGGIGLPNEDAMYDDEAARMGCGRSGVAALADWTSRLKRFHEERLDGATAQAIIDMMTGEPDAYLSPNDEVGLALVRSQLPDAIWNGLIAEARNCPDGTQWVNVYYRWNENPLDAPRIEHEGTAVVVFGSLLGLTQEINETWSQAAQQFADRNSLVL